MTESVRIEVDIAVVGGGPAGLAAALLLSGSGWSVALVAPPAPPEDHRTSALLSGSVDLLAKAGAWELMEADAAPLRVMRLVDGSRRLIRAPEVAFAASELGLEAFGYNIRNARLTAGLAEKLAIDGKVERVEAKATGLVADGSNRAIVSLDTGGEVAARLVVAADGRGSVIREAAGITVRRWSYPQTALVLNLAHSAPHRDTSTEFHTETGPFTLVPLGRGLSSLVCVVEPATGERLMALDDKALATELERRAASILGRFEIAGPRQTWPMSGLAAATMAGSRVALVGEAGHAFPPIGAQGLNLGIRDIAALVEVVGRARRNGGDPGDAETMERYRGARRFDVATRTVGVDLLNRSLLTDLLPVQMLRSGALQLARDVVPIRRFLMREGLRPSLFRSA